MTCALQNKIVFKIPAVHFHFYNGVTEDVSCGLSVEGVAVSCIERNSFCVFSTESTPLR